MSLPPILSLPSIIYTQNLPNGTLMTNWLNMSAAYQLLLTPNAGQRIRLIQAVFSLPANTFNSGATDIGLRLVSTPSATIIYEWTVFINTTPQQNNLVNVVSFGTGVLLPVGEVLQCISEPIFPTNGVITVQVIGYSQ